MKRLLMILGFLSIGAIAHAGMFEQGGLVFTSDTRRVLVSASTATATQVLTRDSYITATWITNLSSFTVMLSTVSNNFSANTTFALPPCITATNCTPWSPDGPTVPYWGPMFAVQIGTSSTATSTLSVLRTK